MKQIQKEIIEKDYIKILLLTFYLALFFATYKYIDNMFVPDKPYVYSHPFDQWWRKKETNISPWYQDHFFDSKRWDNKFPTYQNI